MTDEELKLIHEAIVKDDLAAFKSQVKSNSDLSFCYGRFPILSLCYLYESYNILRKYEKYMRGLSNYTKTDECWEDYAAFKTKAGRAIRLYTDETIHPVEMLAILGESEIIAKYYQKFYKTGEITARIQKIYSLTHDEDIEISTSKFSARRRKLTGTKKVCLCLLTIVFCLMIALPSLFLAVVGIRYGLGTNSVPILVRSKEEFIEAVSSNGRAYKLLNDIVLTEKINVESFSGSIDGNNHTITLADEQSESMFDVLSGEILNLKIKADLVALELRKNMGIIATDFSGEISNCDITITCDVTFLTDSDTYLSMFVVNNDGIIVGSKFNGEVNATNESNQNAFLVGFAGVNNGEINDCKTLSGSFETDTVDVAGIAIENNGKISGCENNLKISQTSAKEWNPNTSGIVVNNYSTVDGAVNKGEISSASTTQNIKNSNNSNGFLVYAAGIACVSVNAISNVKNYGKISATSLHASIYVGGIVSLSSINNETGTEGTIKRAKSFGDISASIQDANYQDEDVQLIVYAGGICGELACELADCGFEGSISVESDGYKFAGGLSGMARAYFTGNGRLVCPITNCYAVTSFNFNEYKGGLVGNFIVGSQEYLSMIFTNCHYVGNSSTTSAGNYQVVYVGLYSAFAQFPNLDEIVEHASIEELKQSAGGLNFDE